MILSSGWLVSFDLLTSMLLTFVLSVGFLLAVQIAVKYCSCSSYLQQGRGRLSLLVTLAFAPPLGTTHHLLLLFKNLRPLFFLNVEPIDEVSHQCPLSLGRSCLCGVILRNTTIETQKKKQTGLKERYLKLTTPILARKKLMAGRRKQH